MVGLENTIYAVSGMARDNLVVSHDQEASNDLLEYVRSWIRIFNRLGIPGSKVVRDRANEIKVETGCRVVAIPGGRPAAIRHFGGNVTLDEGAHHTRLKENLAAAGPVISQANGRIRLVSTVFSDADEFSAVLRGERQGWEVHRTTIHDAIAQGLRAQDGTMIDINELRLDVPDPDVFACEYECIPLSDADSYFPWELLQRCVQLPMPTQGTLYGGFDIARSRRGDLSVVCEVRRFNGAYGCTGILMAERGLEFEAQENKAERLFLDRGWGRMAVDATGLGMNSAERLRKSLGGRGKIDEVTFSPQVKADLMTDLRSLMDQGKLSLPDDRELLLDLHGIKRIVGTTGGVRYDAERNERGHADRAWALALAVRAAGKEPPPTGYSYKAIKRRSSGGWKGI